MNWMFYERKSLVLFVVGRSTTLATEAVTHGDLLQIDVNETYRNMVYKVGVIA